MSDQEQVSTALVVPTVPSFLTLIERVIENPAVPVEKFKALLDIQLLLEDRGASKEYDAAMILAQTEVQTLKWDKLNRERNSRNVSYPKIDKMLRPILDKYHFSLSFDTEPGAAADMPNAVCWVSHTAGHTRPYRLPMPIDGSGPKGGGVMSKNQAVGSGMSYSMRNLVKMIFNIPMLVDKDDTDGNDPVTAINKEQIKTIRQSAKDTKTDIQKFCEHFQIEKIEDLPAAKYDDAMTVFNLKRQRVTAEQAADLQALAEEVRADIPTFCQEFGVKNITNIPALKYADAVKVLESRRAA